MGKIKIHIIPDRVDFDDLDWSHTPPRLLTEKQYSVLHQLPLPVDKKTSKKKLREREGLADLPASITLLPPEEKSDAEIYAFYKGFKKEKGIGSGVYGRVKLVQNEKGQWKICKIFYGVTLPGNTPAQEAAILKQLGRFAKHYKTFSKKTNTEVDHLLTDYEIGLPLKILDTNNFFKCATNVEWTDFLISILQEFCVQQKSGVAHLDIHKSNILYDPGCRKTSFVDFGSAGMDGKLYKSGNFTYRPNSGLTALQDDTRVLSKMLQELMLHGDRSRAIPFMVDRYPAVKTYIYKLFQDVQVEGMDSSPIKSLISNLPPNRVANILQSILDLNLSSEQTMDIDEAKHICGLINSDDLYQLILDNCKLDIPEISLEADQDFRKKVRGILEELENIKITPEEALDKMKQIRSALPNPVRPTTNLSVDKVKFNCIPASAEEEKIFLANLNKNKTHEIHFVLDGPVPETPEQISALSLKCTYLFSLLHREGFIWVSDTLDLAPEAVINEEAWSSPAKIHAAPPPVVWHPPGDSQSSIEEQDSKPVEKEVPQEISKLKEITAVYLGQLEEEKKNYLQAPDILKDIQAKLGVVQDLRDSLNNEQNALEAFAGHLNNPDNIKILGKYRTRGTWHASANFFKSVLLIIPALLDLATLGAIKCVTGGYIVQHASSLLFPVKGRKYIEQAENILPENLRGKSSR